LCRYCGAGVEGILVCTYEGIPLKSTLTPEDSAQYAGMYAALATKSRSTVRTLNPEVCVLRAWGHSRGLALGAAGVPRPFVAPSAAARATHAPSPLLPASRVPQNDLTFLRVRTLRHEVLIAPDKDYVLIVLQNPAAAAGGGA
jgi:hypothetical protein